MNVELFIGLLIMMLNDVGRHNFERAFGEKPQRGVIPLVLLGLFFLTGHALFHQRGG